MTPSDRLFRLLLRAYPDRVRARFGDGMRHALGADLDAARSNGLRATSLFWISTTVELCRFGIAERRKGFTMSGMFTVDWRDAWRGLRNSPAMTAFALLSLALGIGGVTALFSILNGLALKPLPVRDPQRLVLVSDAGDPLTSWTNPIWEAVRDRQQAFADGAFAWAADRFNLSPTSASDIVDGLWISGSLFDVLGVAPVLGRSIEEADDVRGGGRDGAVAVISYNFWQRRFAGAPDVVGRTLTIERASFTIVGVSPAGFFGPDVGRAFDVAIPFATEPLVHPRNHALDQRSNWWINMMARLKPGLTIEQATAKLQALQPAIREATMPPGRTTADQSRYLSTPFMLVPAPAGRSMLRRQYAEPLTILLWVSGLVLLIASANIANLLIARASSRRYELTLRLALGASRSRIARQLLAESLILACTGALLGLALAQWGSRLLIAQLTTFAAAVQIDLGLDWRVLAFATAVTACAAILFGVAPALTVGRLSPNEALKEQGRSAPLERRGGLRQASVILQVAFSLTLVVAAGLFTRTFVTLATRDAGFTRTGVLLVTANVDRNPVDGAARVALFERFEEAARSTPGVAAAGVSLTTPLARSGMNSTIAVPAGSTLSRKERMSWVNEITPGWLGTLGFHLAAGRDFDARDRPGAPLAAIVNRAFERRFLGGRALGATFRTTGPGPSAGNPDYEIVGVVDDAVYRSLRAPMEATWFLPVAQSEGLPPSITIAVRPAAGPPSSLAHVVAAAIEKEDPTAVLSFRTLNEQIDASLTQERMVATLAGFFGALGLVLAAVGLYGVTSHAVTSRRTEIGIRMALGASADGVVRLVLRRVAWLIGIGVALGAGLSAWAATFTRTLLYGLEPRDPLTFAGAAAVLMLVAAVASWLPARRASRIDPMRVLRNT